MATDYKAIVRQFDIRGDVISAEPYGSGHINETLKVLVSQGGATIAYILQRINNSVFPNVPKLIENIQRVTEHLRGKILSRNGSVTRETLTLIPTLDGKLFYAAEDGTFWRMYIFIEGARTFDFVSDTKQAYQAAKAFGTFQMQLADIPGGPLYEIIPKFHDTPSRFATLQKAIAEDSCNRAALAKEEIAFALAQEDKISDVVNGLASGEIPCRVTHNDTKINNVMLDDATGEGICVIDLDTVMPGSVLYDFGDEVRTTTVTAAEDERDLSKVKVRLDLFEALVNGYVSATRDMLTDAEKAQLAHCGSLITFEIGIRFLTDFLQGDVYFKVHRDGHNLDRCRTQFEMVRQMNQMMSKLEDIVKKA